jgi:AcrR family transcriptional regulator
VAAVTLTTAAPPCGVSKLSSRREKSGFAGGTQVLKPQGRGRPGAAETRERILRAVRELLAEGRFHEATVEEIAARAGVARSTLHLHFGSRMGLVDAICELLARGGERAGIRSSLELADPAEALRSVL